jgi:hypothetical protein
VQTTRSCQASDRPLRLDLAGAAVVSLAALLLTGVAAAQGIKRIENCADPITPVQAGAVELAVKGRHDYTARVTFIIDVNGSVLIPRIKESKLDPVGGAEGLLAKADAAFLAAFAEWRYAKRSVPCAASAEYKISVGV